MDFLKFVNSKVAQGSYGVVDDYDHLLMDFLKFVNSKVA